MDRDIKVLVIIPVYNTGTYLRKCLDSVVHQTLQEILIMVINDGSTDNSQEIIDEYVRAYPQIVAGYVTKNQGCGMARNYGINKAMELLAEDCLNDLFLAFVDSDDWLENQALEILYNEAIKSDADIVFADALIIVNSQQALPGGVGVSENPIRFPGFEGTNINDPVQRIMNSPSVYLVWNKIFRFQLFAEIRFPAIFFEDTATIPLVFRQAKKVVYLPINLYNYVRRDDSITGAGMFFKPDALKVVKILLDYATSQDDEIIRQFAMKFYVTIVAHYKGKSLDNYDEYESLNNALFKQPTQKEFYALCDAAVQIIQMLRVYNQDKLAVPNPDKPEPKR